MKRNKRGISLIVLVITVIVMIILAGSVIISLSNSGIIGKANEAVDANNLKQVQQLAALAWSEAYIDKMDDSDVDLKGRVLAALEENKVNTDKYVVTVTETGVEVLEATLGNLIKGPDDYGKTIDYTVTVDGTIYNEWQVYYEDKSNSYVFLIAKNSQDIYVTKKAVASLTAKQLELYSIFKLGKLGYTLTDSTITLGNTADNNCRTVAHLIADYNAYANTKDYGKYIVGAMGSPTIELFAAVYNAKYGANSIIPIVDETYSYYNVEQMEVECDGRLGYFLNSSGTQSISGLVIDELFTTSDSYLLSSPSASTMGMLGDICPEFVMSASNGGVGSTFLGSSYQVARPVVCLSSDIPAKPGTGNIDFTLIK